MSLPINLTFRSSISFALLLLVSLTGPAVTPGQSLDLERLSVPDYVPHVDLEDRTDTTEVVMTCEFGFNKAEAPELDVKWYHNRSTSPFMVWVPGHTPYLLDTSISRHIAPRMPYYNSSYGISTFSVRPTEYYLTGTYSCKVSTFTQEIVLSNQMVVYEEPKSFDMKLKVTYNRLLVVCKAVGGHPKPNLAIFRDSRDRIPRGHEDFDSPSALSHETSSSGKTEDNTVLLTAEYRLDWLPASQVITCQLNLPGTQFYLSQTETFNKYPTTYLTLVGGGVGVSCGVSLDIQAVSFTCLISTLVLLAVNYVTETRTMW